MSTIAAPPGTYPGRPGFLDRENIVARPGFNRWLVPPAALAIHLCIGMAYGFSVFWLPLGRLLGNDKPIACPDMSLATALFTTACDWRQSDVVWLYTLFFVVLGSSAALFGGWLERAGPRKAGVVSALCWCGGLCISALGVYLHQLWLLWLGSGVIGGIGLGLGYISPVSTLIKWFPDRRGMATGMAIMGFGGAAIIGGPLANYLINYFHARDPLSVGVGETFLTMAAIYLVFMLGGAFLYRVPAQGWRPAGWTAPATARSMTGGNVHLSDAHKTLSFWMIWLVLCMNVSAGIGLIGVASPMLQQIFGGDLIDRPELSYAEVQADAALKTGAATIAAGFVALISLFNIVGRFFWASISDRLGRKPTYAIFFVLGVACYGLLASAASAGSVGLFALLFVVAISMYGGGFATVPAYLADVFGTQYVGAIHGRLLTAWSVAGIVGPFIITWMTRRNVAAGVPPEHVYDNIFYVSAGLLVVGFVANLLVRQLTTRWLMSGERVAALQAGRLTAEAPGTNERSLSDQAGGGFGLTTALAWLAVGLPLAWAIYIACLKAVKLFSS